ncbi:hypothetical protein Q428_09340 [Fervidicella metallireducens AeB]|uniref:Lipoprotein n=1 Tax=Fervidicella metallireducens AeB TaxID=1403537 RepID=A0A017RU16_9CLOT|nr:hypothetical protein [Fervidicella metallireducens]EYE88162.1 hypothetical protein Q428_09340 [Fervidicella metallireducens AeB]
MKKVLAVIFLSIFTFLSCKYIFLQEKITFNNISKHRILFSSPGDFDGDNTIEYLQIYKSNDKEYYLRIIDEKTKYTYELNFKAEEFTTQIDDVNNDKKDDFLLFITKEDKQEMYIYTLQSNVIHQSFYSAELEKLLNIKSINGKYILSYNNSVKTFLAKNHLELSFYYTDLDFDEAYEGPIFVSQGIIKSTDERNIKKINTYYYFDRYWNIHLKDFNIKQ